MLTPESFKPALLTAPELESVLDKLQGKRNTRKRRLLTLLAEKKGEYVPTGHVCQAISVGNCSHLANITNELLVSLEVPYFVACVQPPRPLVTKFGEYSAQGVWQIFPCHAHDIPNAA